MSLRLAGELCLAAHVFAAITLWGQQLPTGQTDASKPTNAPDSESVDSAPKSSSLWSTHGIDFSGAIDGYYNWNSNHPASGTSQLLLYNTEANQFSLNMAKLTVQHDADPVGFRCDFGFGHAFDVLHSIEPAIDSTRYIEQAYISLKPRSMHGLQIDFGDFMTSAGAEVFDTKDNWNYSRSLLYGWAEPFYHFGLRTSMPLGKNFTVGAQLVNGWNNIRDNNSGKTIGLTGAWTTSKLTWSHTYYVGPEKTGTNEGSRKFYNSVLLLTPTPKFNAYVSLDYGQERNLGRYLDRWIGFAAAARYQVTSRVAVSPRVEYFNDATGLNTGVPQRLKEFTFTGELKMAEGLIARLEYRRDNSDVAFFDRGGSAAAVQSQNTVVLGLIGYFGPKR